TCAVHADSESIGTCARCRKNFCEVCRTRWRDELVCSVCAEAALETNEATPEQAKTVVRQAKIALVLGVVAWFVAAVAFGVFVAVTMQTDPTFWFAWVVVFGLLGAVTPAVFSIGYAV